MMNPGENEVNTENAHGHSTRRRILLLLGIALLVVGAIARSSIATSLDGFTYDEAYHIGAGVAYVKTGDFRLNPEHPPLTKLWTGAYLSFFDYKLTPYRPLSDKVDERAFVENDVYNNNDHYLIQARARQSMFALNGLLMLIFLLAVWRVVGPFIALGAAAFFAIDPTVAAHLPVVMTDLPVALTSGSAVLLAIYAFRTWRWYDIVLAAIALGLALSSKHSAIITLIAIVSIGLVMALMRNSDVTRRRRTVSVCGLVFGAVVVLWGFYFFQYRESPISHDDHFNRPLADKISDVKSPVYRFGLTVISAGYFAPRPYVWGLADTIRAGAEGRVGSALAFGTVYYGKAPWFYFPGVIGVKVPLGLLALALAGLVMAFVSKPERASLLPMGGLAILCGIFLFFLIRGSSYGGIRHVMIVFPLLAVLTGMVLNAAVRRRSIILRGSVAAALLLAVVSAVPAVRPWEYFNETIGGTGNGHRYFNDEGVDLYQRSEEAVRYYHDVMKPQGERPYVFYLMPEIDDPHKTIDHISSSKEKDAGKWDGPDATGTFIIGANEIAPGLWYDKASFREAAPIARFGNLFVFRGTFDIRPLIAQARAYQASFQIHGPKPNLEKAIKLLEESSRLDPRAFFVALELGNQYLKIGKREDALRSYQSAYENVPRADSAFEELGRQIERVRTESLEHISPLRNPSLE